MTIIHSTFTDINEYLNIFKAGIDKIIINNYPRFKEIYSRIFNVKKMDGLYYDATVFNGTGLMTEGYDNIESIDEQSIEELGQKRFTALDYLARINIGKSTLEDDLYGVTKKLMSVSGSMAVSDLATRETHSANVFNRAFTAGYTGGYDNVCLCSDAHPTSSGGTWSNVLATPADLDYGPLEQALVQMAKYTDDKSIPMNLRGKKLVCSPDNVPQAFRILQSNLQPFVSTNTANYIKSEHAIEVVGNPYLTDPDAWFLIADDPNADGLVFGNRKNLFAETVNEPTHRRVVIIYVSRYVIGWVDPHYVIGTSGG